MSTILYRRISPSSVGNAAVKATPENPVVVLDFGTGWLGKAVAENINARVARGEVSSPEKLVHYFRCGATAWTLMSAVRLAMGQVNCDMVTSLYLSSIPRDIEAWKLCTLSREYIAVIAAIAQVGEQTSNTLFAHRIDLWPSPEVT